MSQVRFRRLLAVGLMLMLAGCVPWARHRLPRPPLTRRASTPGRPIPAGPEARTKRDFDRAYPARLRRLLEPHRQALQARPWATVAQAVLDTREAEANGTASGTPLPVWRQRVSDLKSTGCDDAAVWGIVGGELLAAGDEPGAEAALTRAWELNAHGRPDALAWADACQLLSVRQRVMTARPPDEARLVSDLTAWFALAAEGPFQPGEQRFLLKRLEDECDGVLAKRQAQVRGAIEGDRRADAWLRNMVIGRHEIQVAWDARGSGFASTVSRQGWRLFGEHLALARKPLLEAYRLHPEYPEAAGDMLRLAISGNAGGDSPRLWFDRAVAAQLDYEPAYDELGWSLLPRWGGSHEAMLAFGRECLNTGRYDTSVPGWYYALVYRISEWDEQRDIWSRPDVYQGLATLYRNAATAKGSCWTREEALSRLVLVAWRAQRWADARQALDQVGPALYRGLFRQDFQYDPVEAVGEIYANTVAGGVRQQVEQAAAKGDLATARAGLKQLIDTAPSPVAARYYRRELAQVAGTLLPAKGPLPLVDVGLTHWDADGGQWQRADDGALVVSNTGGQDAVAHYLPPLAIPASLHFVFEVSPGDGWKLRFQLKEGNLGWQLTPGHIQVVMNSFPQGDPVATPFGARGKITWRIGTQSAELTVNGTKVTQGLPNTREHLTDAPLFQLIYNDGGHPEARLRLHELQAQREADLVPEPGSAPEPTPPVVQPPGK